MKHKKLLVLGLMSLFLAGGVATTLALTFDNTTRDINGNADSVLNLTFDNETAIEDVTGLKVGTPVYRDVNLNASQSATAGLKGVKVTFKFTTAGKQCLNGLNVEIFKKDDIAFDAQDKVDDAKPLADLNKDKTVYEDTKDFNPDGKAIAFYRLKITYDGAMADEGMDIAGRLTVSLDKVAAGVAA